MTGDFPGRNRRIGVKYGAEHLAQRRILPVVIRRFVFAFEFDADRIVIAAVFSAKA